MPGFLTAALLLVAAAQSPLEKAHAEALARGGHSSEALAAFTQILQRDPSDTEVQLWIARLDLRLGHVARAEAGFRDVLVCHPDDVDARIGLGSTLTRRGAWSDALVVLRDAERAAGENGDLFAALARAYRHAGDDARAREYYRRAYALSPRDPDIVDGLEAVTRVYGHSLSFEGFNQTISTGPEILSGALAVSIRAAPRLHVQGAARIQRAGTDADVEFGGGVQWRASRATTVAIRALAGPDNTVLPTHDVSGEIVHYLDVFEVGGGMRQLSFAGAKISALSPTLGWDGGRWRLDSRYTYSHSRFEATGRSSNDHSIVVRDTWRAWRRAWIVSAYAYGIERFEVLTAARLRSLGSTTVSSAVRISTPRLAIVHVGYEHQWQSNDRRASRFTLSIVQTFP